MAKSCENEPMTSSYILTLSCTDRPGIVHAVSGFLLERGGNIEEAAQYSDLATGLFFMRVRFVCSQASEEVLQQQLAQLAPGFGMRWALHPSGQAMPCVIMVSKEGHCLNDLLFRWKSGQLAVDIPAIVSNHPDHADLAASYGIPFHHLPLPTGSSTAAKREQEQRIEALIEQERIDLVVLARYMQILSPEF